MPPNAQRGGGPTGTHGGQRNPGVQPQLWNLIRAYSQRLNLDPYAVAAVGRVEGGGRFGEVNPTSGALGPFQLLPGGALPPGRSAAWVNSAAGVWYAMSHMASSGAAGLRGLPALRAIVTRFERPGNPQAEIDKAWNIQSSFHGDPGFNVYQPHNGVDPGFNLLRNQLQQQSHAFQLQQQGLLQTLASQAAQARQQSLLAGIQQQAQQRVGAAQLAQHGVSAPVALTQAVPAQGQFDVQKGLLDQIRQRALQRAGLYASQ